MTPNRQSLNPGTLWLLFFILCLGLAARFHGQNWDQASGQHPDERHVMMCTWRLAWPQSVAEYFDEATSPLNPRNREAHFYAYGTLPGTMLRAVVWLGEIERPDQMASVSRVLSALADTLVIGFVFLLAWTLYGRRNIALIASFFYAFAVFPIQQAHFFVVDPFANLFVAIALVFLARAWRSGRSIEYIATGIALGLALSCKISVATFGLPVALVSLIPGAGEKLSFRKLLYRGMFRTVLFSLTVVITVRLFLPDAFSGFWPWQLAPRWLANMREVIDISTGVIDIPFTRQFYGRIALLWPWWNMVAWGLGLALGLSAWMAWGAAAWKMARSRVWVHAVPVFWIATVFFHQGFTYQATMRYFLPIYGCLSLLAAWGLVGLATKEGREDIPAAGLLAGKVALGSVMVFTALWAVAFLGIYSKKHTRVEASEWIYENIPHHKNLACEHWDDFLPLPFGAERDPNLYRQIELPLYVADTMEKRGELIAKLNEADYVIIASQKLRDSIPRMPHRYPFTISYYEGLEDGTLGFDKVAEFKRPMNFAGFALSTRSAEEAFSVYDHPPVTIYKKAARYNAQIVVDRLNAISLDGVTDTREPIKPQPQSPNSSRPSRKVRMEKTESAILLSPERWTKAQEEGTWSSLFNRNSMAARFPFTVWVFHLLFLQVLGWVLLGPFMGSLPDRGAALARPFAWLIPCWIVWLLASTGLASYNSTSYWLILGIFTLSALIMVRRTKKTWMAWDKTTWTSALQTESAFWAGFLGFLLIRSANPDLWHASWGGEKPMEMTFLYGVIKSEAFPPMNPWFAGGFINYYYFGFVLCGTLIKGLGILPEVGFNLCLATFFGLTCAAVLSVARALRPSKGRWLSWTAVSFVMVLGNLFQIRFIWKHLIRMGTPDHSLHFPLVSDVIRAVHGLFHLLNGERLAPYAADLYWVAARAISGEEVAPVTEFPFWSFLYGDLHPHLMALPFTVCVMLLLIVWVGSPGWRAKITPTLLIGITLGFFWPTNTWDWPTSGALAGLMFFLGFWTDENKGFSGFLKALGKSLGVFFAVLSVGYFAFLPYHQSYVAGYGTFELWKGPKTKLLDYLFIYGLFLFILLSVSLSTWKRGDLPLYRGFLLTKTFLKSCLNQRWIFSRRRLIRLAGTNKKALAGTFVSVIFFFFLFSAVVRLSLTFLLLAGITGALSALWFYRLTPLKALPALFALFAFVLSLAVEYIVLVGDIGRMNTVFKFYYQVWVFYALASVFVLPDLLSAWKQWEPRTKKVWMSAFVLLLTIASLYPVLGTYAKIKDRFTRTALTLDGLIFADKGVYAMKGKGFPLSPDLHAIRWIQDHIQGSPVILEMNTGNQLYTWGSRFSIHTGLPSVAGWNWHQRQQQAGIVDNKVDARVSDIQKLYSSDDQIVARDLIKKYGIKIIVVGELERLLGTPEGLEKFKKMGLTKVYDEEGVQIYSVPGAGILVP